MTRALPRHLRPACALLAAVLLCGGPRGDAHADPAVHFSARLRTLMQRMDALLYERNQSELEIDKERLRRARELAAAARELATEIGTTAPEDLGADAAARREFTALAQALGEAAASLDALATARRYAELPAQMERVAHRCVACHLRFRDRGQ